MGGEIMANGLTCVFFFLASLSQGAPVSTSFEKVTETDHSRPDGTKKIVLLGASIGRGWNIGELPQRMPGAEYAFEYVAAGGFDKSRKLEEVLGRGDNRPDAVILKECAAYFPGDLGLYKSLMTGWIERCLSAGVVPIPATVVPVTRFHAFKKFGIDILKMRNPFKQGAPFRQKRQKQILEYNDWIRLYCRGKGCVVLDLEKAVRKNERKRYLRSRLAKIDGLHLNKNGYRALDRTMLPALQKVRW